MVVLVEKAKLMERDINRLLEDSAVASVKADHDLCLETALKAAKKEKKLQVFRKQAQLAEKSNLDLQFAVLFTLALAYESNERFQEALATYSLILKNKHYVQSGRLRINMVTICSGSDFVLFDLK